MSPNPVTISSDATAGSAVGRVDPAARREGEGASVPSPEPSLRIDVRLAPTPGMLGSAPTIHRTHRQRGERTAAAVHRALRAALRLRSPHRHYRLGEDLRLSCVTPRLTVWEGTAWGPLGPDVVQITVQREGWA